MFSKDESARIRQLFWTSFGKSFPRKWVLYNTKIKHFTFKFVANQKKAQVCLDIEHKDELLKAYYFDKMLSLKNILTTQYLPNVIYDDAYSLDNGKIIARIYMELPTKFNIHNKNTWHICYQFFIKNMNEFELFFEEYKDFIQS